MRLAPHVPVQAPLRQARSALRFSQARLRPGSHSALSLLAAWTHGTVLMPFRKRGAVALTERLDIRVSPAEKQELRDIAGAARMTVAQLVRLRALGRPVVPRTDATTIRELRRLGGLLKKVHLDSAGAYSASTRTAIATLTDAIAVLATGR
jgi:hypothetical protein